MCVQNEIECTYKIESTTTATAPLNDDNDPTNYLPDRCVNQFEVDAITKDSVDDWIVASDVAEANISNYTSKGWTIVATNGTQTINRDKKVHDLEFLCARSKKGLLLSDSGYVCSSSQYNYDVTAFSHLWSSFQEKRRETRIVHKMLRCGNNRQRHGMAL
uniref:DUF4087 domain-containing protein n=1 Tax=Strongyloides venezuelensis TaxID=75913 RepID=A0A0K0FNZ0_STRVS